MIKHNIIIRHSLKLITHIKFSVYFQYLYEERIECFCTVVVTTSRRKLLSRPVIFMQLHCREYLMCSIFVQIYRSVAQPDPGPTKACSLLSTFQALPSSAKQEPCDSITNQTRKQMNYSCCSASTSICMQHIVNLLINTLRLTKYFRPLSACEICQNMMAYEMHIQILKMEATILDGNNHNELHNGYQIWVIIQRCCRILMKLFSSCFRLPYCVVAAGFMLDP